MASCACCFSVFGVVLLAALAMPLYYELMPPVVAEVKGKCAVVTGASYGVGVYIAERLAEEGVAKLIITARNKSALEATAANMSARFPQTEVTAMPGNVYMDEDNAALVKKAVQSFGSCPIILVNNVAIKGLLHYEKTSKTKIDNLIGVNFQSLVHITHDFLPHIIKSKGHIVNIGSQGAKFPAPFFQVYSATKAAVLSFSGGLRQDMRHKKTGVTVHCVMPGFVKIEGVTDAETRAGGRGSLDDLFDFAGFSVPQDTANAVVEAIRYNQPERIVNNPPAVRISSIIQAMFPRFADIAFDNIAGKKYLGSLSKLADAIEKITEW